MQQLSTIAIIILGIYFAAWVWYFPIWRGRKPFIKSFVVDDQIENVWQRLTAQNPKHRYRYQDDQLIVSSKLFGMDVENVFEVLPTDQPHTDMLRLKLTRSGDKEVFYDKDNWTSVSAVKRNDYQTTVVIASQRKQTGLFGMLENALWTRHTKRIAAFGYKSPKTTKSGKRRNFSEYKDEIILSLIAVASFATMWGWEGALILAPLILWHEYGHLVGYRMTGQTGSKIFLVPFFGGLAVANEPHKSEFDRAFCALMGPAICAPLSLLLFGAAYVSAFYFDYHWTWWWFAYAAVINSTMNALNMVPVLPFDGGHIMESYAKTIAPTIARQAMLTISIGGAVILYQAGYQGFAMISAMWGIPALLGQADHVYNEKRPMSWFGALFMLGLYALTLLCHVAAMMLTFYYFY
ncbi:MAG: hypothetical protein QNJ29_14320 [Rhizobiaceae bacterium]|nr:hypothetical protein [Rhizobiaceae bacterium]